MFSWAKEREKERETQDKRRREQRLHFSKKKEEERRKEKKKKKKEEKRRRRRKRKKNLFLLEIFSFSFILLQKIFLFFFFLLSSSFYSNFCSSLLPFCPQIWRDSLPCPSKPKSGCAGQQEGDRRETWKIPQNPNIDVNWGGHLGLTTLHEACRLGYHEIVTMLLACPGIAVNLKEDNGKTPFNLACFYGIVFCKMVDFTHTHTHTKMLACAHTKIHSSPFFFFFSPLFFFLDFFSFLFESLQSLFGTMPARYHVDLRWRIVWSSSYFQLSPSELSLHYFVSLSTIHRILNQFHTHGTVFPPIFQPGREQLLDAVDLEVFCDILAENPTVFLREARNIICERLRKVISLATLCRTLQRHHITKRKVLASCNHFSVFSFFFDTT